MVERQHEGEAERTLRALRWGLIPSWSKDQKIGSRLINARVETLASKPAWRTAFAKRRAVISAGGYIEWQRLEEDGKVRKQPYFIHPAGGGTLSFAGLYALWPDPARDNDDPDRWMWSATIITTDAHGPAGEIHDRTPLILPRERVDAWLDPTMTDTDQAQQSLTGIDVAPLELRAVTQDINRVGNNRPDLIDPMPSSADQPLHLSLTA